MTRTPRWFTVSGRTAKGIGRAVDTELQFHLDMRFAELVEAGLSEADARETVTREFGDLEFTRRYCREQDLKAERAMRWRDRLDELARNTRYAVRSLRRSSGFAAVAIVTLALAIGANTAIFSVANAVLLAPLPFGAPHRLVALFERKVRDNVERSDMSAADLADYRDLQRSLTGVGILTGGGAILRDHDTDPVVVQALRVSANMFDVLQARPALGRTFAHDEDSPGKGNVAVLSTPLWRRVFGGDSSVIGQTVTINDASHVVIGVMPQGFGLGRGEEMWLPLDLTAQLADVNRARKMHYLYAVGRLRPGVSLESARADLGRIARTLEARYPDANTGHLITVLPMQTALAGTARRATLILSGAATLVLLIACGNLGNVMLARAEGRRREMVVRVAIGASRAQLVAQLLTESIVLAAAGGVVGVMLAVAGTPLIVRLSAGSLPPLAEVQVDGRVLAFSFAVSLVMGLLMALVPALVSLRLDLNSALKEASRSAAGDRRGGRVRESLVVGQVAVAVVLMVVAGLLVRSFEALRNTDLGFQPKGAVVMSVAVRGARYQTKEGFNQFYDALFARLRASPGITAVGGVSGVPLVGSSGCGLAIEDQPFPPDRMPQVRCLGSRGDYFKAIGTPLLSGRMFSETDLPDGPQVAVINAAMARQFWPGESPLGKRIRLGPNPSLPWMTIVGVVGDQRQNDVETAPKPTAFEYDPQHGWGSLGIVVRTTGDPLRAAPLMRAALRDVDPSLAVRDVRTLEEIVGLSLAGRRFSLGLIASFALLALLLAAVGIYGVLAYIVTSRTREFGIRMALGASAALVRTSVVRHGLVWVMIGLAIGAVGGFAFARLLSATLYGVTPGDPATFVGVALAFTLVALLACLVPARRATRVDPLVAMRSD